MFTRNLLLLIILSSCSITSIDTSNLDFDDSFSSSDKFQFNKCLGNSFEKIKLNDLEKRTPQRRLGSEQEVTDAVIFSCSNRSSFMTGETLVIDGGWTAFGFYN